MDTIFSIQYRPYRCKGIRYLDIAYRYNQLRYITIRYIDTKRHMGHRYCADVPCFNTRVGAWGTGVDRGCYIIIYFTIASHYHVTVAHIHRLRTHASRSGLPDRNSTCALVQGLQCSETTYIICSPRDRSKKMFNKW